MNTYFVCIQPSWKRKIKGNADVGRKSVGARCIDFDLTFVALKFTYFPCVSIWVSTLMSFSMRLRSAWNILLVKYFVCVKGSFVCFAIGYWPDMVKRIPLIRDSINLFFLSYYELTFCELVHFLTRWNGIVAWLEVGVAETTFVQIYDVICVVWRRDAISSAYCVNSSHSYSLYFTPNTVTVWCRMKGFALLRFSL